MITIVSVSGGLSSAEALRRCVERYGRENVVAVFADVKGDGANHDFHPAGPHVARLLHERFGGEAPDLYRFLWRIAYALDVPIERLSDGLTIWSHMAGAKAFRVYSGGRFFAPCSARGKREIIARWIQAHYEPGTYRIALGMDWSEDSRLRYSELYWRKTLGWDVEVFSPLTWKPYGDDCLTTSWLFEQEIEIPSAYTDGMEHNNCNGGCVQAGHTQFYLLHTYRPGVFWYWAEMERAIQGVIGRDVTILKDERGGQAVPMSLYEFAERIQAGYTPRQDTTPCMCFSVPEMATFLAQAAQAA